MKKHILIIIGIICCSTIWAQSAKTFLLDKDYDKIIIQKGWKAEVVQTMSFHEFEYARLDGNASAANRIEVFTNQEIKPSQVFHLQEGTLRLKENRHLPEDTRVVIYTAQRIRRIDVREYADLQCRKLEGYEELTIAQWTRSHFVVDTLASPNLILGYKGDSSYFHCNYIKFTQLLWDNDQGNHYGTQRIALDTITSDEECRHLPGYTEVNRLLPAWVEAPSVKFNEDFSLHLGLAARYMTNAADTDTYFGNLYSRRYNIGLSIYGKWVPSHRWTVNGGVRYDWFRTSTDLNGRFFKDHYLGIPLSVTYHPFHRHRDALGIQLGLTPSVRLNPAQIIPADPAQAAQGSTGATVKNPHSQPFRLELTLGLETNLLGIIHGIQFYANLLPTKTDLPSAPNRHEFGIAISL